MTVDLKDWHTWIPVATAVLGLALVASVLFTSDVRVPYAPLETYEVQMVDGKKSGSGDTVIKLARGFVPVTGTKCNREDHPVEVKGEIYWRPLDPGGESFLVAKGQGIREPGCETTRFQNTIPDEVIKRVKSLGPSFYEINGTECPLGEAWWQRPVCRTWHTERFLLVP